MRPILGKGGSHGADAPCSDLRGMTSQLAGALGAAAAHMYYNFEIIGLGGHPCLGQTLALVVGKHISLARRTVDKHALQAVFLQHCRIRGYRLIVDFAVLEEWRERGVDKTLDFLEFHNSILLVWIYFACFGEYKFYSMISLSAQIRLSPFRPPRCRRPLPPPGPCRHISDGAP